MKKKMSSMLVVGFALLSIELSSLAVAFQLATSRSFTFTTSLLPPQFSRMLGYDVIGMPSCGVTTDVGKPMLPVKIVPVLLPPDADVEKIELTTSQKEDLTGNYKVFPAQPPIAGVESELPEFVEPDRAVYESDRVYPNVLFENSGVYWMQGYKILNIRIFPVQYVPRDGKLTYYRRMRFIVTVTSTGLAPSRNTSPDAKNKISGLVANPEKADVWVASSVKANSTPSIDYVIITTPSFQDEFQVLADWKIYTGISASVYTTTWIYSNYAGVDNQEKIRNFIFDMYSNSGTSMVLLGGDYNIVPPRYIYMEDQLDDSREAGGGLSAAYKPTDYYYACLDGNWDPNGNGKYLEQIDTNNDGKPETCVEPIPDFYPEVYVGRLPAGSEAAAEFLVTRTVTYEMSYLPSGRAMLLGAIGSYYNEDGEGSARRDHATQQEWVNATILAPCGMPATTMYEKDGLKPSEYPCTCPLTLSNVQTSLSSGCYIMSTSGHGSVLEQWRKIWVQDDGDGVPEEHEMYWAPFIDSTAMTLSNGHKLPQVYVEACLNGKFDDTNYDCVAERLVELSGGGAIAVIAASRISYGCSGWRKGMPGNPEFLCLFWQEFFRFTGPFPGEALYNSKSAYYLEGFIMTLYWNKKNLLIYNLFGDPGLRPWAWPIHIKADGSVDPPMAPISSYDNKTYRFTDNIHTAISVERSNIIVDGNGYTLQGPGGGPGGGRGFQLLSISNVTIKNTNIKYFGEGVYLFRSSNNTFSRNTLTNNVGGIMLCDVHCNNNTVSGNTITNNGYGICLGELLCSSSSNTASGSTITNNEYGIRLSSWECNNTVSGNNITKNGCGVDLQLPNNTVSGNNITNNEYGVYVRLVNDNTVSGNNIAINSYGVYVDSAIRNKFYHNNFIDNTQQVYTMDLINTWDDGHPSGGNYWSNYTGVDVKSGSGQDRPGSDGIGDTPYVIDADNQDHYPLMKPFGAPPPQTHNLTIATTGGGTIDPTPGTYTYTSGTTVTATALPQPCFMFDHWELDGIDAGSANPISVLMDDNHTLHAVFIQIDYTLTITYTSGGRTDPDSGIYIHPCGSSFQVTAYSDDCHKLDHWELDENDVGSANPYSVLMDNNYTLHAVFVQINYTTLTITITDGGTTDPSPGVYTYPCGSSVQVTAFPHTDYVFDHWELDGSWNYSNPINVTMYSDHTLRAVFCSPYNWPMFHHDLNHTGYSPSKAPNTNNTIWSYTTGHVPTGVFSSPAVVDGKVYVGSGDCNVYCFDASTGTKIWSYTTGNAVWSSPAVVDGKVYVGSIDRIVYCLDAATGAHIWNYATDHYVESSPAVVDGKVYVGSWDGNIYCLDASNGAHIWNYTTGHYVRSSPAVVDGKVYVGSCDDKVYCLDASNGAHIWNYTTGGSVLSSPAVVDGKVYVGSCDDKVYCLDASNGAHIWNYTTDYSVKSSPAVVDSKVYIGSGDGKVHCLDASNGTRIWNYTTGDNAQPSPAVADGKVFVGSWDGKVYCLDASTGTKIWSYTTGDSVWGVWSSPAVADGKVYIGSGDGKVHCFGSPPDVAVTNVTPSKTVVFQNYSMSINVTVENQGNYTETFNVTVYYNSNVINHTTITNLLPGEETTITLTWNTTGIPKGNYTITAKADTVPGETDTLDNTYIDKWVIVSMLGDITGPEDPPGSGLKPPDGKCDIKDVAAVAKLYGVNYPDSRYDPNCDLTGPTKGVPDGKIDIKDVALVAKHYGDIDP